MSRISQLLPEHRFFPLIKQEFCGIAKSLRKRFNLPPSSGGNFVLAFETAELVTSAIPKKTTNDLLRTAVEKVKQFFQIDASDETDSNFIDLSPKQAKNISSVLTQLGLEQEDPLAIIGQTKAWETIEQRFIDLGLTPNDIIALNSLSSMTVENFCGAIVEIITTSKA